MEVTAPLPIALSPTLRLERPDESQMAMVRDHLSWLDPYGYAREHFETTATHEQLSPDSSTVRRTSLPESEQRYLLLTFSGNGNDAYSLLDAAQLAVPTLWSLLHVHTSEPFGIGDWRGHGGDSLAYQRQITEWVKGEPHPVLDEAAIGQITAAYAALCRLDRGAHPGAWRAVELFRLFSRMPLMQVLDVLAMFMLIEMLLTHNPSDKGLGDSLAHQVVHKVPFVFARSSEQIDYSAFGDASSDEIWKGLYAYRSCIAHGEQPDFSSRLQILHDAPTANLFLTHITRRLIRFCMDDPQLFEGLKPL